MAPETRFRGSFAGCALVVALLMLVGWPVIACGAEPPETRTLPEVQVVDTLPLSGIGVPLNQVPANVQSVTNDELSRQPGANLSDFLNLNLGSVNINDTQGNPFQPDVNFRGFGASPILGTPQGLSVYVDGVRVNEAFGDTVNWDLIPKSAISSMTLLPGSNPVFGLNTLGGALTINTKNGFQDPGTELRVSGGSFGRQLYEFESGGHGERADYFVTANLFDDKGWGQHNPSRVNQLFAETGYRGDSTQLQASFTYADTKLSANQALPASFFNDPAQAYTFPDVTANRLAFFNLKGSHAPSDNFQIAANAYYRSVTTSVFNSNISNNFNTGLPPGPGNQPATNAVNDIGDSRFGGSLQLSALGDVAVRKNNLTVGFSYDRGNIDRKSVV
jgi:iron complex outermembrane receptor protein